MSWKPKSEYDTEISIVDTLADLDDLRSLLAKLRLNRVSSQFIYETESLFAEDWRVVFRSA